MKINYNKHNLSYLFLTASIWLYFIIPKYDLIHLPGISSGLRVDDFLVLFLFIFVVNYYKKIEILKVTKYFYFFLIWALLSSIVNIYFDFRGLKGLIYTIRWFEYFVFFIVGYWLMKKKYNLTKMLIFLFMWQSTVAIFQSIGLIGAITSSYGIMDNVNRVIGTTGGPWELSPLITILLVFLVYKYKDDKKEYLIFVVLSVGFIIVLLTGSRIGIVSFLFAVFSILFKKINLKTMIIIIIIFSLFSILFIFFSDVLVERLDKIRNLNENIYVLKNLYDEASTDYAAYKHIELKDNEQVDLSWLMRASKWVVALKVYLSNPVYYLIGVGPGAWGDALDGGLLRLLTENGLIGLLLFLFFFLKISVKNIALRTAVFVLLINMIFIDLENASKFMSLLYLLIGYHFSIPMERRINKGKLVDGSINQQLIGRKYAGINNYSHV